MITIRTCTTRSGTIEWEVPEELAQKLAELPKDRRNRVEIRIRKLLRRICFLRGLAERSTNRTEAHALLDQELKRARARIRDVEGSIEGIISMMSSSMHINLPYALEVDARLRGDADYRGRVTAEIGFYAHTIAVAELYPSYVRALTILNRHMHTAARHIGMLRDAENVIKH